MYDELVKSLRNCAKVNSLSLYKRELMKQAAAAIEELSGMCRVYAEAQTKEHNRAVALENRMRWIPVTERLPKFEGAVLCMRKSNVYGVRPYQEILYVDEFGFKNFDDIYLADGVVTHWMPLPEPPKEET